MPFEMKWHIPYRVIDDRFWGKVTLDEMHQQAKLLAQMLEDGELHMPGKRIHILYDTNEAENIPPLYLMLKEALPVLRYKNRGPMFHITKSSHMRSIIEITAHITQFPLYTFSTREDAILAVEASILKDDLRVT